MIIKNKLNQALTIKDDDGKVIIIKPFEKKEINLQSEGSVNYIKGLEKQNLIKIKSN